MAAAVALEAVTDGDAALLAGESPGEVDHDVGDLAAPPDRHEEGPPLVAVTRQPRGYDVVRAVEQAPQEGRDAVLVGLERDDDEVAPRRRRQVDHGRRVVPASGGKSRKGSRSRTFER